MSSVLRDEAMRRMPLVLRTPTTGPYTVALYSGLYVPDGRGRRMCDKGMGGVPKYLFI